MGKLHWILAISLAAVAAAHDGARAGGGAPPGNHYGWCKGNGNPHASGCAASTNGGTVNGNSGHAPPPTSTEAPHPGGIVTGTYGQSFTGYAPVPPIPPQLVPQQPPPYAPPPLVKKPVPQPRPAQGSATPADVVVHAGDQRTPLAGQMIPRHAGRQHPNAQPRFEVAGSGEAWTCVASGFQRRRHVDETGAVTVSGVLPNLAMVDGLMRDIPAYHEHRAECLVGVQLRPEHAARGSARPRN